MLRCDLTLKVLVNKVGYKSLCLMSMSGIRCDQYLGFRRRPSKSRISFISMLRCDLTLKSWCEYFLG